MASAYLVKKGDIYYFRHYIPLKVQLIVCKKEFIRTLKVTQKNLAVKIARELKIIFDSIMDKSTPSITWKQICGTVDHAFDKIYEKYVQGVDTYGPGHTDNYDPLNYIPPEYEEYVLRDDDSLDWNKIGNINELADKIIEWANLEINKESREYQLFCYRVIQMLYQHRHRKENPERYERNIFQEINANIQSIFSKPSASVCNEPISSGNPLLELYEKYIKENSGAWTKRTRLEKEGLFGSIIFPLVEIATGRSLDNIRVQDIDNEVVNKYVDSLRLLPAQFTKRFKNKLTLSEAIDYARKIENDEVTGLDIGIVSQLKERVSTTTINGTYIQTLSALLGYGVACGYVDKNYLVKRNIKAGQFDKATFRPFDGGELESIFSHEIFSKKIIHAKKNVYSNKIPYFKYWVPILGLFTGAREAELAQLMLKDICSVEDIHYLNINNDNGKKVKNKNSIRLIPLHPVLTELGFLKYVNWLKKNCEEYLFPEMLNKNDKGSVISKWFSIHINDKCQLLNNVPMTLIGFHSFRNNFANEFKQKGVQSYIAGELMGHQTVGMTYGRYGSPVQIKNAYENLIKSVTYDGVEFPWSSPDYHKIKFPWD